MRPDRVFWAEAVALYLYLWNKRGGFWKRRQKFVFRSRQEWESVKAIVDELVREL